MVIDVRPRIELANAAARLAASICTDPAVERDVTAHGGADAVAEQLVPIVAWAIDVGTMTDLEAIRIGVNVAGTRMLLGTPRRIVLAAVHELPAVLTASSGRARGERLDAVAIEVGLRLRREGRSLEFPAAG